MRSSVEWIPAAATSYGVWRIGQNPYATVPNASRTKWESVKPVQTVGSRIAPGSFSATQRRQTSNSGVSIGEIEPPFGGSRSSTWVRDVGAERRGELGVQVPLGRTGQDAAVAFDARARGHDVARV